MLACVFTQGRKEAAGEIEKGGGRGRGRGQGKGGQGGESRCGKSRWERDRKHRGREVDH